MIIKLEIKDFILNKYTLLINNFNPSAKGCKIPNVPILIGPWRIIIPANNFRSNKVQNATLNNKHKVLIIIKMENNII